MSNERRQILTMLAEGKITAEEAEKLLDAIGAKKTGETEQAESKSGKTPKFLCVRVDTDEPGKEKVNIKIPLMLIKAGVKLKGLIPGEAKAKISGALHEKGLNFDLDDIDSGSIDEILKSLQDCCIDVDGGKEKVKIYCE